MSKPQCEIVGLGPLGKGPVRQCKGDRVREYRGRLLCARHRKLAEDRDKAAEEREARRKNE